MNLLKYFSTSSKQNPVDAELLQFRDQLDKFSTHDMGGGMRKYGELAGILPLERVKSSTRCEEILAQQFYLRNEVGDAKEDLNAMYRRVASVASAAEMILHPQTAPYKFKDLEDKFHQIMESGKFLPSAIVLRNAGKPNGFLSDGAVFVLENDQSQNLEVLKLSTIAVTGGMNITVSCSVLLPPSALTEGDGNSPGSAIKLFQTGLSTIRGESGRRGSVQYLLRIDHPDILDFIRADCARTIAITDSFMQAYDQQEEYTLLHPVTKSAMGKISARYVLKQIIQHTTAGNPLDLWFIDRANSENLVPDSGDFVACAPSGGLSLMNEECAVQGYINLANMLDHSGCNIDRRCLSDTVEIAVRFLDNLLEVTHYLTTQGQQLSKRHRRIGVGVMGLAELLCRRGVSYASEEGLQIARDIARQFQMEAHQASRRLAETREVFISFTGSSWEGALQVRNANITALPAEGETALIAQCTPGIKPLGELVWKNSAGDIEIHRLLGDLLNDKLKPDNSGWEKAIKAGSIQTLSEIPAETRLLFQTIKDIDPIWPLRYQAVFQEFIDGNVIADLEVSSAKSEAQIEHLISSAYFDGCRGVRLVNSKVIARQTAPGVQESAVPVIPQPKKTVHDAAMIIPRQRPQVTTGSTIKLNTGCGHIYVTVNADQKGACEVLAQVGKGGGCKAAQIESICRLVSLSLRAGVSLAEVVSQLSGIRCAQPYIADDEIVYSCGDAVAQALRIYAEQNNIILETKVEPCECVEASSEKVVEVIGGRNPRRKQRVCESESNNSLGSRSALECPDCHRKMVNAEGAIICPACGFAQCKDK